MHSIDLIYYSIEEQGLPLTENQLLAVLNNEERERYHRFLRPEPKAVFGHARYMLKTALAKRLNINVLNLEFSFNDKGKPYLPESTGVYFNLSHCNSAIAVAISELEVGVDVEMINHRGDPWHNPADFLNHTIALQLESCHPDRQQACFYRYWTALEAFTKSRGKSIFQEKDNFAMMSSLMMIRESTHTKTLLFVSTNLIAPINLRLRIQPSSPSKFKRILFIIF